VSGKSSTQGNGRWEKGKSSNKETSRDPPLNSLVVLPGEKCLYKQKGIHCGEKRGRLPREIETLLSGEDHQDKCEVGDRRLMNSKCSMKVFWERRRKRARKVLQGICLQHAPVKT